LSNIDIAFLQIHVPTEDDGTQDLMLMKELITKLPDVPVFVRTTILPGTSDRLSNETGHQVHYMPEFLTERTHIEDFKKLTLMLAASTVNRWALTGARYIQVFFFLAISMIPTPMSQVQMVSLDMAANVSLKTLMLLLK